MVWSQLHTHSIPLLPPSVIAKAFRQADTEETGNVPVSVVPSLAAKVLGSTAKESDLQLIQFWVGQKEGEYVGERGRERERKREREGKGARLSLVGWVQAMELATVTSLPSRS